MKYHNKKVIVNGIKFDSKKESLRYLDLKMLERANEIKELELQKKFELLPSFKKNNKTYQKITYIADFYYYNNRLKKYIVEDTKGYRTNEYKLKKKLFEFRYPELEIKEL